MGDFGGEGEERPCGTVRVVGNDFTSLGFTGGLSWAHLLIFRSIGSRGAGIRISHRAVGTP